MKTPEAILIASALLVIVGSATALVITGHEDGAAMIIFCAFAFFMTR